MSRLVRALSKIMGVEEIKLSSEMRVRIVFHPLLIAEDDLVERIAELGYAVRQVKWRFSVAADRPSLH